MYNLVRYLTVTSEVTGKRIGRAQETHVWNKSYSTCKGMQKQLETQKWTPGTYFKPIKTTKS